MQVNSILPKRKPTPLMQLAAVLSVLVPGGRVAGDERDHARPDVPVLAGPWQTLCTKDQIPCPDIRQGQVVDHCFYRDAAGKWQAWVQFRGTKSGRVFTRWEQAGALTDTSWSYRGVHWRGDPGAGEIETVIQAPHVYHEDGRYWAFYGGGGQICMARSDDGVHFTRHRDPDGLSRLFADLRDTTPRGIRDPFAVKFGERYHLYYTSESHVLLRTAADLDQARWSQPRVVAVEQNRTQCPFVVRRNGWYYLFMMGWSSEFRTHVLASRDPADFGKGLAREVAVLPVSAAEIIPVAGQDYVSSLQPDYAGIRIAPLRWQPGD